MLDYDFIGFSYNGKHSIRDLNIYRTGDGSRYNEDLTATMTDLTADVPGGDGQYYFGTTYKNRTFIVNYAFEALDEVGLNELKKTFSGDGVHDLIFDEAPYKIWSAKVVGTASIKHICFSPSPGVRIYKGEGSITFICYFPFARVGGVNKKEEIETTISNRKFIPAGLYLAPRQYFLSYRSIDGTQKSQSVKVESATEERVYVENLDWPDDIAMEYGFELSAPSFSERYFSTKTGNLVGPSKLTINGYSLGDYPTKQQWEVASGLEKTCYPTKMGGQVSAPVRININANPTNKNFKVGSMEISLASTNRNALIWDTSTGIIKDTATNEIVPYSGVGYGKLAPGTELTVEGDASIDLDSLYFLYY